MTENEKPLSRRRTDRTRPRKCSSNARTFVVQPTVTEQPFVNHENDEEEDDEGEDEEACDASERCKINIESNEDDDEIEWVQCEKCEAWWHTLCAGLDELPDDFTCENCCY